jgi:dihydroxyacetone kinase-like protein
MKKLIDDPSTLLDEALTGLARAHPALVVESDPRVVRRVDAPVPGKVGLVSGGGSGHEPLHVGFVGRGMLDAACPGAIFTSPTPVLNDYDRNFTKTRKREFMGTFLCMDHKH